MFEIGRVCMKIAGRDAGRYCVIVETHEKGYVTVDGNVRRKKVNARHLEPLGRTLKVSKGASHDAITKAFKDTGLDSWETKPRKKGPRPAKQKAKKTPAAKKEKPKAAKKEAKKAKADEKKAEGAKSEPKKEDSPAAKK